MAVIVPTTTHIHDSAPSIDELQKIVGGYFTLISISIAKKNCHMIVNEEAMLFGMAVNEEASNYAGKMILGNVAILHGKARLK
jgi:hypothetical protein